MKKKTTKIKKPAFKRLPIEVTEKHRNPFDEPQGFMPSESHLEKAFLECWRARWVALLKPGKFPKGMGSTRS